MSTRRAPGLCPPLLAETLVPQGQSGRSSESHSRGRGFNSLRLHLEDRELRWPLQGATGASGPAQTAPALAQEQWAVMGALACGDDGGIEVAEQRAMACAQRLRRAALVLYRVVVKRGDQGSVGKLIEGALRLAATV